MTFTLFLAGFIWWIFWSS